jgi:hypothetical protein
VNWPEELFHDHYNPAPEIEGTIAVRIDKLLMNVWKCVGIERTMETETGMFRIDQYALVLK